MTFNNARLNFDQDMIALKIKYACLALMFFISTSVSSQDSVKDNIEYLIEKNINAQLIIENQYIHCQKSLTIFYRNLNYQPVWNNSALIQAFLNELNKADHEGLEPKDYHIENITTLLRIIKKTTATEAKLDLILTDAFLLYASHLLYGKVNSATLEPQWSLRTGENRIISVLEQAVQHNNIKNSLENIKPKHAIYLGLKQALGQYKTIKQNGGWQIIPAGSTIKEGDVDPRIPLIRARLIATSDLSQSFENNSNKYDHDLVNSIKEFQVRHGIDIDGEIGFKTMAAMNINVDERIEQIKINLERWRWLSRQFGDYYIKVNIADFNLEVIKNGEKIRQHKIIVGRTYRKTPIFSSKITHLVFNPSWTVPPGILSADVLPAVRKNIRYLKNKNIYVYDKNGKIVIPSSVDWNSSVVKSYTYRQTPGSDNALGSVKFFIPNEFMVYLHDTPSKDLFEKTERAFSSGCIRVQDPLELAEYLLNDPENYSKKRINGIINTKKTQTVVIKDQPAIHILYWTSFTNDDGVVQFRSDIYKRDGPLKEALLKRAPSL